MINKIKSLILSLICAFTIGFFSIAQSQTYIKTELAKQDFDSLFHTIENVHFNPYFKNSKKSVYELKKTIFEKWNKDSIPLKEFIADGMRITAKMSGGHTLLDWQNQLLFEELSSYSFIPFSGKISLTDKSFEVTTSASNKINKETKVKSINGIHITELFEECTQFIGGIEAFKKTNCETLFPLYLFFTNRIKAPYNIKLIDGTSILEAGININQLNALLNSTLGSGTNHFEIIDNKICVLHYNHCENPKEFKRLLKVMFRTIKKNKVNHLVVDIRNNSGGNSYLNEMLLSYITNSPYRQSSGRYWKVSELAKNHYKKSKAYKKNMGRKLFQKYLNASNGEIISELNYELISPKKNRLFFNGETRILIGPKTFSSANFLADAVKTYKLALLIGSETGENTNDFGETVPFQLQNSECWVYVSSTYDIGCDANPEIHLPVKPDVKMNDDVLKLVLEELMKDELNLNNMESK